MKFYRSLKPIKAISFDLDDTLYSNRPVMVATERAMPPYFQQLLAPLAVVDGLVFDRHFWAPHRTAVVEQTPELTHDVTALRLATYQQGMESLGIATAQATELAQQAMAYFLATRSNFVVPPSSIALLQQLRQYVPVVAISNGNVDTEAIGIKAHFDYIYHAGNGHRMKPAGDLFEQAAQDLGIACEHMLHVGDCGRADILGALRAGCQAAWLSCYDVGKPLKVLPHIELSDVTQLAGLAPHLSS
ncbi:HAD family hydrolase [Thalassotalea euphylliae]|uniref:HAD family hydrolase n=1 Tax=Thalassotalea euphylliae TaxID=1655234 RepID=A0A3E0TVR2_9GAMM|nr:HAD-IA family hydrolase [Thalassotalea euphylliae]REL28678.1 HAD family hydrolase [Thalassotalea euphylliae]